MLNGKNLLSCKELRIVKLVSEGLKNSEIGEQIGNTEQVVKNYLRVIYDKVGMFNRLELALWYVRNFEPQLLPLEPVPPLDSLIPNPEKTDQSGKPAR